MSKSLWLQEECKCGGKLYVYTPTDYHIKCFKVDCSQCNEFKEVTFESIRELKKVYKLKTKI